MLGKIVYISDNEAHVKLEPGTKIATNLINIHVILENKKKRLTNNQHSKPFEFLIFINQKLVVVIF